MSSKIPVFDLSFAAFSHLNHNTPELENNGGRVTFLFDNNETFFSLTTRYHSNEAVPVIDFVTATRQIRAMMLSKKAAK